MLAVVDLAHTTLFLERDDENEGSNTIKNLGRRVFCLFFPFRLDCWMVFTSVMYPATNIVERVEDLLDPFPFSSRKERQVCII